MLENELAELDSAIEDINSGLERVFKVMDDILSHPAKNYDITFKKEHFHLSPPLTMKDEKDLASKRRRYIFLIMNHVLKKRIRKLKSDPEYFPKEMYETWYALCYGENPEDHKLERVTLEEVSEMQNEKDKEYGKSRPLDEESYQVNQELDKADEEEL